MPYRPKPVAAVDIKPRIRRRGRPAGSRNKSEAARKKECKWILKEKKKLCEGLKIHSPDDIASLNQYVPNKTEEQIEAYMDKQIFNIKLQNRGTTKTPIEHWSVLVNDLVLAEKKDYTENLATVMSIAANFEDHPTPDASTPDYAAIYRCIAAILQGKELPDLGHLECGVILDLLHGLVDTLRSHNTEEQRQIMLWKYKLLCGRVDRNDPMQDLERCRKAIENDFSDFTSSRYIYTSVDGSSTVSSSQSQSAAQATSSHSSQSQTVTQQSSSSISQSPSQLQDNEQEKEKQLGNVGLIPSPTKIPKGNTGSNISNTNPDSHAQHTLGPKPNDTSSDITDAGPELGKKKSDVQEPGPSAKGLGPSVKRRGRGKQKKNEVDEKIPKKPKMFTLNPFCIPVNQLKLQPKTHVQIRVPDMEEGNVESRRKRGRLDKSGPLSETPTKIATFTNQVPSLSGINPNTPGGSTRHTRVMVMESPYTGIQPKYKLKQKTITSKMTEVVVVTPGDSVIPPTEEEVMKKGLGIVPSHVNEMVMQNLGSAQNSGQGETIGEIFTETEQCPQDNIPSLVVGQGDGNDPESLSRENGSQIIHVHSISSAVGQQNRNETGPQTQENGPTMIQNFQQTLVHAPHKTKKRKKTTTNAELETHHTSESSDDRSMQVLSFERDSMTNEHNSVGNMLASGQAVVTTVSEIESIPSVREMKRESDQALLVETSEPAKKKAKTAKGKKGGKKDEVDGETPVQKKSTRGRKSSGKKAQKKVTPLLKPSLE